MLNEVRVIKDLKIFFSSVFDNFIFLNTDEIGSDKIKFIKRKLINRLNKQILCIYDKIFSVRWEIEKADYLLESREALAPTSKESSFLFGKLYEKDEFTSLKLCEVPIKCNSGLAVSSPIIFENIKFYIYYSGVMSLSLEARLKNENGFSIPELIKISDFLRYIIKFCFEKICYEISKQFKKVVQDLMIPHYTDEYFPDVENFNYPKRKIHILPWIHRIYYIEDKLLLEDPKLTKYLQILLEPGWRGDIQNYSFHNDRFIYFGWGHSAILTGDHNNLEKDFNPYHYIRIIEIAQVNWRSLELLIDLIDEAIHYFREHSKEIKLKNLNVQIDKIREFSIFIHQILDKFEGVEITFNPEKRYLLKQLNIRWLTEEMSKRFKDRLKTLNSMLKDFQQNREAKSSRSISRILLIFTIMSIIQIIGAILDIISPQITLDLSLKILLLIIGTIGVTSIIIFYLNKSSKKI